MPYLSTWIQRLPGPRRRLLLVLICWRIFSCHEPTKLMIQSGLGFYESVHQVLYIPYIFYIRWQHRRGKTWQKQSGSTCMGPKTPEGKLRVEIEVFRYHVHERWSGKRQSKPVQLSELFRKHLWQPYRQKTQVNFVYTHGNIKQQKNVNKAVETGEHILSQRTGPRT